MQDDNPIKRVWHPEPNHKGNSKPGLGAEDKVDGIISHHEVLARLQAFDTERGELIGLNRLLGANEQEQRLRATEDTF